MQTNNNLHINHVVSFTPERVSVDGAIVFEKEAGDNFVSLAKRVFLSLENSYAKYHKMDRISKLAFLSGELLFQKINLKDVNLRNIAVILSNSSATIETDTKFQKSISEIPSPAIFVYTLPNIMIGELCIRFGINGENLFFVEPKLNTNLLTEQARLLFDNSNTEICILGWVDYYTTENYVCYMASISREQIGSKLTQNNLNSYFK